MRETPPDDLHMRVEGAYRFPILQPRTLYDDAADAIRGFERLIQARCIDCRFPHAAASEYVLEHLDHAPLAERAEVAKALSALAHTRRSQKMDELLLQMLRENASTCAAEMGICARGIEKQYFVKLHTETSEAPPRLPPPRREYVAPRVTIESPLLSAHLN